MKSSIETRKRFKERIEDALKLIQDSDELTEALNIVDDLNEVLEIAALSAEYLHNNKSSNNYDDDDDYGDNKSSSKYNLTKMKEYLIHRLDLFLGVSVLLGGWKNTNHWVKNTMSNLESIADSSNWGFTSKSSRAKGWPYASGSVPLTPPIPLPVPHVYKQSLESILNQVTNNQINLISVVQKTNGDFELTCAKGKFYLRHGFVTSTVTILNSHLQPLKVFKESDLVNIASYIKVMFKGIL